MSISIDAVELKCLLAALEHGTEKAAKIVSADGFMYTQQEIEYHIQHGVLVTRSLLSQVTNLPEDEESAPKKVN